MLESELLPLTAEEIGRKGRSVCSHLTSLLLRQVFSLLHIQQMSPTHQQPGPNLLDRGLYSQRILRLKVAPYRRIYEQLLKIMGVSVVTLGLLIFENKSYSQNILGLKVAPESGRP